MSTKKYHRRNYGALGKICPRQMKNGVWRFDIKWMDEHGRWHHQIVKHAVTEVDAWKELVRINEEVRMKRENPERAKEMQKKRITFAELTERCKEAYFPELRQGRNSVYIADAYIVPFFGKSTLDEITSEDAGRWKCWMKKKGITAEQTLSYYGTIAKAMWNKAKKWGYKVGEDNPFSGRIFRCPCTIRTRILVDNLQEEQCLLEVLREPFRTIVICSLLTLMRKREILNLRWTDIHWKDRYIYLEWERNKSKRNRKIPLCRDMYEKFQNLYSRNGNSPYVFPNSRTGQPYKDIRHAWLDACKKAGIEDLRFHDLRRTGATRLYKRGAKLVSIQKILGHTTIQQTMTYLSIDIEDTKQDIELLNQSNRVEVENKRKTIEKPKILTPMPIAYSQGYGG